MQSIRIQEATEQQSTIEQELTKQSSLQVKDVMSVSEVWLSADATLAQAAFTLSRAAVNELVVLDDAGNFVGILTSNDILFSVLPDVDEILAAGGSIEAAFSFFLDKGQAMAQLPILPLIRRELPTVEPDNHIAKAATLLAHKNEHVLPVLQNGKWIGMLFSADICQAVLKGDRP